MSTEKIETLFKVAGQWYCRGNASPAWFYRGDRADGSASGLCERVPAFKWPLLDALAAANQRAERLQEALKALYKAAVELCDRADYDLVDSGQWVRLGAATDAAEKFFAALAQAQASGEGER
jgi:hypothetical protein